MSLRAIAESDLNILLEDDVGGFGYPIKVTDPEGSVANLKGYSSDIAQVIDPDTGEAVSGRLASCALRISSLMSEGLGIPEGIVDNNAKPWIIEFDDINGVSFKFKVQQSNPDRALGLVTCHLEMWNNG